MNGSASEEDDGRLWIGDHHCADEGEELSGSGLLRVDEAVLAEDGAVGSGDVLAAGGVEVNEEDVIGEETVDVAKTK